MNCEIITIGDELLIGQVVDTNSAWMAERLNGIGISVKQITSIHDDATHIKQALTDAMSRADVILLTGGLGPTKDDITKSTLCEFFGAHLVYNDAIRSHLLELYKNRPEVLNRLTDTQCLIPDNCEMIPNKVGSAQGMLFRKDGHVIISMPGVPYEMMWLMDNGVISRLEGMSKEVIYHRTVQVFGWVESALAIHIEKWEDALPANIHLAYLPKDGIIRLRLSGYGVSPFKVDAEVDKLCAILGDAIIATEDKPIEMLVGEALKEKHMTISTAESCTGGKIAQALNRWPGSSEFYYGSVVAYDNSVKQHVLGVSADSLREYGAVSEQVVRQMAEGVRNLLHTDFSVATSGIAGPDGGTAEKPVGTVWIAISSPEETIAECLHLGKLREQITDRARLRVLIKVLQKVRNINSK